MSEKNEWGKVRVPSEREDLVRKNRSVHDKHGSDGLHEGVLNGPMRFRNNQETIF